uniref:MFS transporter n=1 Tax=candidate division WOR-3 bacterium TaxID=2052148 RepID=A0A7C4TFN5_UNCW3
MAGLKPGFTIKNNGIIVLLNFLYSTSWILASVFIPLIARRYTEDFFIISAISALYNGMLFLSSAISGRLGDIYGRKLVIIIGFFLSAVLFFLHNQISSISSIFLYRGLAGIGIGMIPGSLSALAWGGSLGFFTGIGSLGFTLGNFLPGLLKKDFLIFTVSSLFCAIGFILSFFIREKRVRISVPILPYRLIIKNLDVYLPFFIRHSAAQAVWAIFPIHLVNLGADKFQIGLLYAINPFFQFLFMLYMDKFSSNFLIPLGIIASAITFLGYAISQTWQAIIPCQVLLGFAWATLYLGSLKKILANNVEQATASGILSSVIGLSGIVGPIIGGIIANLGLAVLLFSSALLSGLALTILIYLTKNQRG